MSISRLTTLGMYLPPGLWDTQYVLHSLIINAILSSLSTTCRLSSTVNPRTA